MEKVIENFIAYMARGQRRHRRTTEISYERDLKKLARYLRNQKIMDFSEVTKTESTRLSEGIAEGESGIIYNFQKYCINKSTVSLYDKNRENAGRSV